MDGPMTPVQKYDLCETVGIVILIGILAYLKSC